MRTPAFTKTRSWSSEHDQQAGQPKGVAFDSAGAHLRSIFGDLATYDGRQLFSAGHHFAGAARVRWH